MNHLHCIQQERFPDNLVGDQEKIVQILDILLQGWVSLCGKAQRKECMYVQKERSEHSKSSKLCKAAKRIAVNCTICPLRVNEKLISLIANKEYLGYTLGKKPARTGQWNKLVEEDFALGFSKNRLSKLGPIHQWWPRHAVLFQDGQLDSTTPNIPLDLHFVDFLVHTSPQNKNRYPSENRYKSPQWLRALPGNAVFSLRTKTHFFSILTPKHCAGKQIFTDLQSIPI